MLFVSTICRAIESIERLLADCIVETGNCQLRHLLKQVKITQTKVEKEPQSKVNMEKTYKRVSNTARAGENKRHRLQ